MIDFIRGKDMRPVGFEPNSFVKSVMISTTVSPNRASLDSERLERECF